MKEAPACQTYPCAIAQSERNDWEDTVEFPLAIRGPVESLARQLARLHRTIENTPLCESVDAYLQCPLSKTAEKNRKAYMALFKLVPMKTSVFSSACSLEAESLNLIKLEVILDELHLLESPVSECHQQTHRYVHQMQLPEIEGLSGSTNIDPNVLITKMCHDLRSIVSLLDRLFRLTKTSILLYALSLLQIQIGKLLLLIRLNTDEIHIAHRCQAAYAAYLAVCYYHDHATYLQIQDTTDVSFRVVSNLNEQMLDYQHAAIHCIGFFCAHRQMLSAEARFMLQRLETLSPSFEGRLHEASEHNTALLERFQNLIYQFQFILRGLDACLAHPHACKRHASLLIQATTALLERLTQAYPFRSVIQINSSDIYTWLLDLLSLRTSLCELAKHSIDLKNTAFTQAVYDTFCALNGDMRVCLRLLLEQCKDFHDYAHFVPDTHVLVLKSPECVYAIVKRDTTIKRLLFDMLNTRELLTYATNALENTLNQAKIGIDPLTKALRQHQQGLALFMQVPRPVDSESSDTTSSDTTTEEGAPTP